MFSIADKLQSVSLRIQKATIRAERESGSVQLLAVSKKHTAKSVIEAYEQGQRLFGENYLSEALEKQEEIWSLAPEKAGSIEWHFIGPIQSNKTRLIAENFAWVHGVDRLKVATRLNDQRPETSEELNVCIQVNIDQEATKSGISLDELDALAEQIAGMDKLCLRGIMAIPSASADNEQLAKSMHALHQAKERLVARYASVDTLSMGMSKDLELAIEHGSTMVRVGTDIFGERKN